MYTSLLSLLPLCTSYAVDKPASEVFKKWLNYQQIIPDVNLASMKDNLSPVFFNIVKMRYQKHIPEVTYLNPFLSSCTAGHINEFGCNFSEPYDPVFIENFRQFYTLIEHDISGLFDFFKQHQFAQADQIKNEEGANANNIIDQYSTLMSLFFANPNQFIEYVCTFAVANRLYEFCFNPKTWPQFNHMLIEKKEYPYARFLYSIIWQTLAGIGWKHWHEESLKSLQQKAAQGNRIIYIAGGSDIYQLIKAGIYNITNIDPQLPTQPQYYAEGWDWILYGNAAEPQAGIGDRIIFNFEDKNIVMKRTRFVCHPETFQARLASGEIIQLNCCTTEWSIFENDNFVGTYVLERRPCQQDDFIPKEHQTLLMSFNELFFISAPAGMGGWGIDITRLPNNLEIIIKQLRKPVTKSMLGNMRLATLLNFSDFKFISLGTCIN